MEFWKLSEESWELKYTDEVLLLLVGLFLKRLVFFSTP